MLRSIELIDLGHATIAGDGLFADGGGTPQYFRPARREAIARGQPFLQQGSVDQDVYAYASLLARFLLGRLPAEDGGARLRHADAPYADEIEALVADRASPDDAADEVDVVIAEAFALLDALLQEEHAESAARVPRFLRAVERIENEAIHAMPAASREILALLSSLDQWVPKKTKDRWCERYAVTDRARALRELKVDAGAEPSLDLAVHLLRVGFVSVARGVLGELLRGPRGEAHDAEDARALRLYVGQILLREHCEAEARAMLARYAAGLAPGAPPAGLAWWIRMLGARFDLLARRQVSIDDLAIAGLDDRQKVWLAALEVLCALHRGAASSQDAEARLASVRHARNISTSERMFVHILQARCLAKGGRLEQALRTLQQVAGEAAKDDFPVEYATVLVAAGEMLFHFDDRSWLEREGIDADALLEAAGRLALDAAELLHGLGMSAERDRAIHVAGRCGAARTTPAGLVEAACWHELAYANAVLDAREPRVQRAKLDALRDPGTSGAQPRYDHHAPALERLWGHGGLTVEIGGPGAALEALIGDALDARPEHVLVIGCGAGDDVVRIAERCASARRIHGVDAFAVNVDAARQAADATPWASRCTFRRVDLIQEEPLDGEEAEGDRPWDLVVMREALGDVTLKRPFLRILRRCLRPGAHLRLSELVQTQPAAPRAWRALLQRLGFPNLTSRAGLLKDLDAAHFAVDADDLDAGSTLVDFLLRRQAEVSEEEGPPSRGMADILDRLVEAAAGGVIGWLRVRATATRDDPPSPPADRRAWPLSSFPPPSLEVTLTNSGDGPSEAGDGAAVVSEAISADPRGPGMKR